MKRSKIAGRLGKVGVLMGGPSSERQVSLKSGMSVYNNLKAADFNVVAIDIKTADLVENIRLIKSHKIDCAFIALHGHYGEDGQIQGLLDILDIPYTGSSMLASKLAMDKIASRQVLEIHGLFVPRYKVVEKVSYNTQLLSRLRFGFPWVIKPATNGSSIGLSIIDSRLQLDNAVEEAFAYDDKIIVEEYIRGRELTVGILRGKPLPVIEIVPKNRFFDFEAKYSYGLTDYIVPAKIEKSLSRKLQQTALKVHKLLGCSGCSRVDIILDSYGLPYILELNSIPGLTPTSLLPKAAQVLGIDFTNLCIELLMTAYEKA